MAGGARGEEHRRHVAGRGLRELGVEEAGVQCVPGAAGLGQRIERSEPGLGVVAQAAAVVVPDVRELRALGAQFEQLVDLLLVFDDGEADLGVVDRVGELGRHRVLVQRHDDRAERLRREHRRVQPRPVLADHDEVPTALQAGLGQAAGQFAHQLRERRPTERLPDAVFLFAQRRRRWALRRVFEHQARKGRGHGAQCRKNFDAMLSF